MNRLDFRYYSERYEKKRKSAVCKIPRWEAKRYQWLHKPQLSLRF